MVTAYAGSRTAADVGTRAAVDTATAAVTPVHAGSGTAALGTWGRHFRARTAVPGRGAMLRPRRVGRAAASAAAAMLALCLKRGGTHQCDAKHQDQFCKSLHDNGLLRLFYFFIFLSRRVSSSSRFILPSRQMKVVSGPSTESMIRPWTMDSVPEVYILTVSSLSLASIRSS